MNRLVDVIVPTIPERRESLARMVRSLTLSGANVNLIVVPDSETCGAGWKKGLELSHGAYVLLACDDQEFAPGWDKVCKQTVDGGKIPCPRVWWPDGSIQSQGGDMESLHHLIQRPQKDGTEVQYSTVPFLSREQADAIGMLDAHYATDVWVSLRGKQLGWPTVLRHGYEVKHHREQEGRGAGMSEPDRDAMDCERVFKELAKYEEVAA